MSSRYQGRCFPFRASLARAWCRCGRARTARCSSAAPTAAGGSPGPKPFAIERLVWTKSAFEIEQAKPDGFELTFTKPISSATAAALKSPCCWTFTYIYRADYGSPEVDRTTPEITKATVNADRRSVRLTVKSMQEGHIHDLRLPGVRSADGEPLLHPQAYYTLNYGRPAEVNR
ncbi:MAG: hypothetical protein U0736_12075 [Gemmataceae bacterium]